MSPVFFDAKTPKANMYALLDISRRSSSGDFAFEGNKKRGRKFKQAMLIILLCVVMHMRGKNSEAVAAAEIQFHRCGERGQGTMVPLDFTVPHKVSCRPM